MLPFFRRRKQAAAAANSSQSSAAGTPAASTKEGESKVLPRLFRITTQEGSTFWARFNFQLVWEGIELGQLTVLGDSRLTGQKLRIQGVGSVPEPGSGLVVSDVPLSTDRAGGEELHRFPEETIVSVTELPIEPYLPTAS